MIDTPQPMPASLEAVTDADIRGSFAAIHRSAASARDLAIQTRTGIVVRRDGRAVYISYEHLMPAAQPLAPNTSS